VAYSTETLDRVPNTALRERYKVLYETEEHLNRRICRWMVDAGYKNYERAKITPKRDRGVLPDATLLKRKLGVMGWKSKGKMYYSSTLSYEEAVELCRALDMDPHEAGV